MKGRQIESTNNEEGWFKVSNSGTSQLHALFSAKTGAKFLPLSPTLPLSPRDPLPDVESEADHRCQDR
jgi:hypothetical protein